MKRVLILLVFLQFLSGSTFAQQTGMPDILLDHYTIGKDGKVGSLFPARPGSQTAQPSFRIIKGRRNFVLKGNTLYYKGRRHTSPAYDITVEMKTGEGVVNTGFRILQNNFNKNKVIAHRGAFKNNAVAENSIAALQHAIRLGCEGSEFDIHMSADSVPFINHDPTINGLTIEKTPSSTLAAVKLSHGEALPTLDAYLEAGIKQYGTKLILEIKPSVVSKERALELARRVVAAVYKHKAQAWVDYISFDYEVLQEVLRLDPHARVAYLRGDRTPEQVAADKMFGIDYNSGAFQQNKDWIARAHQQKLTVNVWTVNDPALMDFFIGEKVDFITTNEPEILLQKMKNL